MDWEIVLSVVVGMAIFLLGIAMIGGSLVWLMVSKIKKSAQGGANRKFSFPCAGLFGDKAETSAK